MKTPFSCLAIASLALLASCAFTDAVDRALLRLPFLPPAWARAFPDMRFRVEYEGEGGKVCLEAGPGASILLSLPKGLAQRIVLHPVNGGRELPLRPAAAFYPYLASTSRAGGIEIAASFELGFASAVASAIESAGARWDIIDYRRLAFEASRRVEDPWELDPLAIAEAALAGELRASLFAEGEKVGLDISGLRGALAPESPFGQGVVPSLEGCAHVSVGSRPGLWMGAGQVLVAAVDGSGSAFYALSGLPP